MNILYICVSDPRLTNNGAEQRTNLLWKALLEKGTVYTIAYDNQAAIGLSYISSCNPICIYNPRTYHYNRTLKGFFYGVLNHLCGLATMPFKFPSDYKPEEIFKGVEFDIVVSRYMQLPAKYHLWNIAPTFVDIDDHPIQAFETIGQTRLPNVLKGLGRYLVDVQFNMVMKKVIGVWLINKEQINDSYAEVVFLPNIPYMPSVNYNGITSEKDYLFTIGLMSYEPNYSGVDKFLNEIWPDFHRIYPKVKYLIGGKGAPENFVEGWKKIDGVEYRGYIDNLEEMYEGCCATVVPIYQGAGTCIKTLESLAYSRVCLSTPFGARGFSEKDRNGEQGLLVFNTSEEFIQAYEKIETRKNRTILESKARAFIEKNFSEENFRNRVWELINESLYKNRVSIQK